MPATTRLDLPYPALAVAADGPEAFEELAEALDGAAIIDRGALASRPVSSPGTPGIVGRLYIVSDVVPERVDFDYGTGWLPISEPPTDLARLYSSYVEAQESITSTTFAVAPGTVDEITFTPPPGAYIWVNAAVEGDNGISAAFYMNGTQVFASLQASATPSTFSLRNADILLGGSSSLPTPTDATPANLGGIGLDTMLLKAGSDPDPLTLQWRFKVASGSAPIRRRHLLAMIAGGQ